MFKNGFSLRPVVSVTGRVGYVTRVQDRIRVAYPTRLMTLATEQKPCPSRTTQFTYKIDNLTHLSRYIKKTIKHCLYTKYMK